mmetsp:Transcript_51747/g.146544  ORF Transcript_51747/g.146544 Transcript_51747/m.146544 type:complete len:193 (-) Transcript_51747:77-655(-)
MAFAASLPRMSSDIQHRLNAEIEAWVSEQVDRTFKRACQAAASNGDTSVQCTSGIFRQAKTESMSTAFANQQRVVDAVTTCFCTKLAALGLSACEAEPRDSGEWFFDGGLRYGTKWNLKASWLGVPEQEEAPQQLPSGASAECPVCLEIANVVVLFPCGHTMCRACAGRIVHAACPSCRQWVTGVSQGLFLG